MPDAAPRIVVFGMRCGFSEMVLTGLIAGRVNIQAVVLPAVSATLPLIVHWPPEPERRLPVAGGGIVSMAGAAGIPVVEIASPAHRKVLGWLAAREPDLFVVACFPWKLPRRLRAVARLAAVNIHPSLLPAGRGPDPLFWTFRRGERQTGVTLHLLDEGFDTGPIVAQEAIAISDGIREAELEADLALRGARLFVASLAELTTGAADAEAQGDTAATMAPIPSDRDFVLPTDLPARWAYNFARGVAARHGPLRVMVMATGEQIAVADAVSWRDGATAPKLAARDGDRVVIQFQSGIVVFAVAPDVQDR